MNYPVGVRAVVAAFVFGVGMIFPTISCSAGYGFPSGYAWYKAEDFDKALAHAKREGKRIMVIMTLPNCRPCEYTRNQLTRDEFREVYEKNFVGVFAVWPVSAPDKDIWYRYTDRVTAAPTWVFLNPDGKGMCRQIGAFNLPPEGLALGKKVVSLDPASYFPGDEHALPRCSTL